MLRDLLKFDHSGTSKETVSQYEEDQDGREGSFMEGGELSTTDDTPSTEKKLHSKKHPPSRQQVKKVSAADHARAKTLKLAESYIFLQKENLQELKHNKEMMLFMNGPDRSESERAKELFSLKQGRGI